MRLIICKEYKIFITSFPRLAGTMRTRELQMTHDQVLIAPSKRFDQTCTRQGALPSKQRNASSQIQQHAAERPLRRNSFSGPVQPPSFIFGQSTGLGRLFRPSNFADRSTSRSRFGIFRTARFSTTYAVCMKEFIIFRRKHRHETRNTRYTGGRTLNDEKGRDCNAEVRLG